MTKRDRGSRTKEILAMIIKEWNHLDRAPALAKSAKMKDLFNLPLPQRLRQPMSSRLRLLRILEWIFEGAENETQTLTHRNQKVSDAELLEAIAHCGNGASYGEISRALGGRIGRGAVRVRVMKMKQEERA